MRQRRKFELSDKKNFRNGLLQTCKMAVYWVGLESPGYKWRRWKFCPDMTIIHLESDDSLTTQIKVVFLCPGDERFWPPPSLISFHFTRILRQASDSRLQAIIHPVHSKQKCAIYPFSIRYDLRETESRNSNFLKYVEGWGIRSL